MIRAAPIALGALVLGSGLAGCGSILGIGDTVIVGDADASDAEPGGDADGAVLDHVEASAMDQVDAPAPPPDAPVPGDASHDAPVEAGAITTVATGLNTPYEIAIDAINVYWTASDGTVGQVSLNGGTITTIASGQGQPHGIAVGSGFVFWTDNGGPLMQAPIGGGTAITLAVGAGPGRVAVDSQRVYFSSTNGGGVIEACAIGGCAMSPSLLAGSSGTPWGIAVTNGSLYWTDNVSSGPVIWMNLGTGMPVTLAPSENQPGDLAFDAQFLYWADYAGGQIRGCGLAGCAQSPSVIAAGQASPVGIGADGVNVYWANHGDGTVNKCGRSMTFCNPVTIAANQTGAYALAVDSTYVYWATNTNPGGIFKAPK